MIRQAARKLRTLARRSLIGDPVQPAILMYHRIGELAPDPWRLSVTSVNFRDQMQWLARHRRVMPMQAFVDCHAAGTLPRDAAAVTFDDGYADNALEAQPILQAVELPATLFVVSGAIGRRQPFWWDTLGRLILNGSGDRDATLTIGEDNVPLRWRREDLADRHWHFDTPSPGPREAAYLAIWGKLQRLPDGERQAAMRSLQSLFGAEESADDRAMDEAEFADLARTGVFAIAGHSATHAALTSLSSGDLHQELRDSLAFCRTSVPQGPIGFAYPYGDSNGPVRDAVVAAGFAWACSTRRAAVRPGDDRFALPRLAVGDWPAAELKRQMTGIAA